MAKFKFNLSQRVIVPAAEGKGIQGIISGRTEYVTGGCTYEVTWLNKLAEFERKTFAEIDLLEAMADVIDAATTVVRRQTLKVKRSARVRSRKRG